MNEYTYYAQPNNQANDGFYFDTLAQFTEQSESLYNARGEYNDEQEGFTLEYTGSDDEELFRACEVTTTNLAEWFKVVEFQEYEKAALFFLCDLAGFTLAEALDKIGYVTIFKGGLEYAAVEVFDELQLGSIPSNLLAYINYDEFANDMKCEGSFVQFDFNGHVWTCTNANNI